MTIRCSPQSLTVLDLIRREVRSGRPFPGPTRIARYMGWAGTTSSRNALDRLVAGGLVRRKLDVDGWGRETWVYWLPSHPATTWARRRHARPRRWSPADLDELPGLIGSCSAAEVARLLGRSETSVRAKARQLGLQP